MNTRARNTADTDDSLATRLPGSFAEAWRTWLGYRTCGSRPLRLSTRADYESIYRRHVGPHLGDLPLDHIDGLVIARLVVALSSAGNLSAKRISNVLVPVRACLRWHHRMGAFAPDPSPWFDTSAPPADERRILTIEQIERLIAATPAPHRAFIATAAYTGLRAGELRALTWADVNLDARTLSVTKTCYRNHPQPSTKTGHDRIVPVPPHLAEILAVWHKARAPTGLPDTLVFPGPNGGPLDLDTFRTRVFKPAVRRAGLPEGLRIHDLRHTSASLYLQSGATVREVMEIHGWRQMQTALRYLHTGDALGAAAERLSEQRRCAIGSAEQC